jgi:hypothetical protein
MAVAGCRDAAAPAERSAPCRDTCSDGRGFAGVFHPAVDQAQHRQRTLAIEAVDGRIRAFSGSERRRQTPKVASSKAVDVDPARVLAQCCRSAAASHEFSGDINGLGGL